MERLELESFEGHPPAMTRESATLMGRWPTSACAKPLLRRQATARSMPKPRPLWDANNC
jgi:hypothetical protein